MKKEWYDIDREFIEETANDMVEDLGINTFPIDVFKVAELLKIRLIKYSECPLKKRKILLKVSEDGFSLPQKIYYNDRQSANRVRFTILHEIGHIQLEHHRDSSKSEWQKETEANCFAGHLLAPLAIVCLIGVHSQQDIAEIFTISWDCAQFIFQNYLELYQNNEIPKKIQNDRVLKLLTKYDIDLKELAKKRYVSNSILRTISIFYDLSKTEDFSLYNMMVAKNEAKNGIRFSEVHLGIRYD